MNIGRTLSVARKESIQIVRDTRSMYLALGIPVMLMVLFGYALSLDVDNIPMAVWDQDKSPESRQIIDRLTSSGYFNIKLRTDNYRKIVSSIDDRTVNLGLVIPIDFADDLYSDSGASIQAIVDGSDSTRSGIAIGYLRAISTIFVTDLRLEELEQRSVTQVEVPIEPRIRLIYNPELESRINIIPGLIAIIMMVIAALLTSLTIVREWETGTMEQIISTPVTSRELVVGKLIPYFGLGFVDLLIAYGMARYLFDTPFRGSLVLMFIASSIFLVGALSMGILVSAIAETQVFATQFALLGTFLPSFLISGFVFPIENMPAIIQVATYFVPARYYITILRGIFLKGVGLEILWFPFIMLIIFGIVTSSIASTKLGKKLR
jgi:ABC-2 type transport system permease protein